jgi:RNA methyltransferase, TrmH family
MHAGTIRTRPRLIESRQNPRVKQLRAALARSGRTPEGLIAVEGEHLVEEALLSRLRCEVIYLRQGAEANFDLPADTELLELAADVFESALATQQPQGIAALVHAPPFTFEEMLAPPGPPLLLVLAGLQDPGNVGTLLRSAEAFGATGALLLPGTASPWNPKALRASAGSAFRLPTLAVTAEETLSRLKQENVAMVAAVARDGAAISAVPLHRSTALLIGNEGAGLPASLTAAAAYRITIAMPGAVESLNAAIAGSLLLYEAARQRQESA